ncbi:MAG: hypothetical protein ACERKD_12920 [Prolixibacteraceae bacterium]
MKNSELKSLIYKKLDELDEDGLKMVNEMVTQYLKKTNGEEGWDSLSDEDKTAIEEGIRQIENGQYYTHEEVMERIHKKFGI